MEELSYYKQLPYRLEITHDPVSKLYHAEYPDLPGCAATDKTLKIAIQKAELLKAEWCLQGASGSEKASSENDEYYATHDHDLIDTYMADRKPLRVAAYIRETVPKNGLRSPLELQQHLFESEISGHPGWSFAGTYIDKGEAQLVKNRPGLMSLLADCEAGNIDVVICRSISRLFRFVPDAIKLTNHLVNLTPPVGVYFEKEETFTLSSEGKRNEEKA